MARKKGGGGKLNRSEIIQARLDPKLHMAAEIMARSDRRTLSSFIEKSIEQVAKHSKVKRNLKFLWWLEGHEKYYVGKKTQDEVTVEEAVQEIGTSKHEYVRFVRFGTYFPDLLNKEERRIYESIMYSCYFWLHYPCRIEDEKGKLIKTEWLQVDALEGLDQDNLQEYWDRIKSSEVNFADLCVLPQGKQIDKPLKEDVRAIRKKIRNKSDSSEKWIYLNQSEKFEIPSGDDSWKKHVKNSRRQKIEVKKTDESHQVIATYFLDGESELAWIKSVMEKMEK